MSKTVIKKEYRCWNDCVPQGCPGHEASIEYQSVSNSLIIKNGRGQEFFMQTPELEAFQYILRELGKSRIEIERIVDPSSFFLDDKRPARL